ncbi:hypothetical protein C8F01DRAFT_1103343 [Mycena amicta]|nr:hypothetical protein C8F01DRAFT_1103343 [Mycena amicta]
MNPPRQLPARPPRPLSRPLPAVPHPISCRCGTMVTSRSALLPESAIPSNSARRSFKGFSGKACLFTETYNVIQLTPKVQLMQTGAHLLAELNCNKCSQYLGYKIVRAFEKSERWKEDRFLLELAELLPISSDSDSEDSC